MSATISAPTGAVFSPAPFREMTARLSRFAPPTAPRACTDDRMQDEPASGHVSDMACALMASRLAQQWAKSAERMSGVARENTLAEARQFDRLTMLAIEAAERSGESGPSATVEIELLNGRRLTVQHTGIRHPAVPASACGRRAPTGAWKMPPLARPFAAALLWLIGAR
jgi:hypothetical protein